MNLKNKKRLFATMFCLGVLGAPLTAGAGGVPGGAIYYDELNDGDISWGFFTLGEGINIISGTMTYRPANNSFDFDNFDFEVPAGMQLVTVEYDWFVTDRVDPSGPSFGIGLDAEDGTNTPWSKYIDVTSQNGDGWEWIMAPGDAPLGEGTYSFNHSLWQNGGDDSVIGGDWDYGLVMEVTPVPVPAAAWLFGSSLLGLGLAGRRRKQKG